MDTDTTEYSVLFTYYYLWPVIWLAGRIVTIVSFVLFSFVSFLLDRHERLFHVLFVLIDGCAGGLLLLYTERLLACLLACFLDGGILLRLVRSGSLYAAP